MIRIRRIVPVLTSVCLAFPATGAVSGSGRTARGTRVIQYSDLPELVETYSPQVQMERTLYETRLGRYESARGEMMETRRRLREEAENMKKDGDSNGASNYRIRARVLEEAAEDMDRQIRSAKESPSTMSLYRMGDAMIWTAQSLIRTYRSLRAEQEGALAEAELMQGRYEKAARQAGLGVVSQAVAGEAGKTAIAAANKVRSLQDDMERVRKELLMVTGCPGDFQVQIGMLPTPDRSRVDGITLEADKWRALRNNYELGRQRDSSSDGIIKEHHVCQRIIEEGEVIMYDQIGTLYQSVLAGRTMWQGVATAQIAREVERKATSNKMDLDMLSRQEYLEVRSSYLDGAVAKAQADMDSQQAMDMYDQAVKGLMATN